MDWINCKNNIKDFVQKYRYAVLILMVGILLLLLPEQKVDEKISDPSESNSASQSSLETALSEILSKIVGAGKVEVLLTLEQGEETIYQLDQDISNGENSDTIRSSTVLITNSSRNEEGLIRQIKSPIYRGAIVVSQGADSANVRLAIVEAVMSVTGLTSDCITVLKMK